MGPGEVRTEREPIPSPTEGQVLVEAEVSAISSGTEMHFFRNTVPEGLLLDEVLPDLGDRFGYPLKYGYASVGRVRTLGEGVDEDWKDRRVMALHPHESHFLASPNDLHQVPDDVPSEDAVMVPAVETAVGLVMDGRPVIGEEVVVMGQGVVGLLTTGLLSLMPLGRLVAVERRGYRMSTSLRMGAQVCLGVDLSRDEILEGCGLAPEGADLAFELSGNPEALGQAVSLVGYGGRVVVGSWYGERDAEMGLGTRFHRNRISIMSSQVSRISPSLSGRWDKARRYGLAWDVVRRLRPSKLVTHRFPVEEAGRAYEIIDRREDSPLQVLFTYGS